MTRHPDPWFSKTARPQARLHLIVGFLAVLCCLGPFCILAATAVAGKKGSGSQAVVERIEFMGNRRVRNDTLKARIFTRAGDLYNEETLRRDFQALWNTQFFEDVRLRVEDSADRANGKIVIFELKERAVIRRIRYLGIKSVSESDILDRFKERKVGLTVESQFDPTRIKKAQVVLKELLGEHGRQFAHVTPQYERIASSNAVVLIFKVDEGPKVKVGRIRFTGNHAFSDRKLIRAMRHDRPYAIPMYFFELNVMSKTYDRDKLNEDLEVGVRGLHQDNGYFRVLVKEPVIENVDTSRYRAGVPLTGRTYGKAVNITVPIEEGFPYRMGALRIVSADPDKGLSLKVDVLKSIFPIKQGESLNVSKLRKAMKDYTSAYGEYGFIDFTAEPDFDIDDANKIVNVTLKFDEQKQYYVRRIEFTGNTTTRDKVIRRELLIDEGQLFNKRAWEISILRLNQLDYFERIEPDKAVELKRNVKEGTVDLNLKVHEKGKQAIGLQGGVSGLAGGFIGLTYQTNNFLGLGETLSFAVTVYPTQGVTLSPGETYQFTDTVTNVINNSNESTAVYWYVNDAQGGNATTGSITTIGLYTAPAQIGSSTTFVVKATLQADSTSSGQTNVTVIPTGAPTLSSINPTTVAQGAYFEDVYLSGSNFTSTSVARINGSAVDTTFISSSVLRARIPAEDLDAQGTAFVDVMQQSGVLSGVARVDIVAAAPTLISTTPAL